jgi:pyrophosphate--fructose-6-phosphate 1-phosphotransferase
MKIAFLTAGGIAPCLSASIGALIEEYNKLAPDAELIGYLNGYRGLLLGKSIDIPDSVKKNAKILSEFGGSPIGNSRVKLTNIKDCINNGYVNDGEDPLEVAAKQLVKDKVDILHTIGGDDTNTMAAALAKYLQENNYNLTVVGIPKTVDNDVVPITQTLGALTAAEQGAIFFENIVNENTTSTRQLIIHEVMGRHCGWLTAATAVAYRHQLNKRKFLPEIQLSKKRWDIDAIYIPEIHFDMKAETKRLRRLMDEKDCVNIFLSEGAGKDEIVAEMEANSKEVPKDAFGHVKLDKINPGKWFAKQFSEGLKADRTLVQKSGYFARSAAPNKRDLALITASAMLASESALAGKNGVVGMDYEANDMMALIEFDRIKGGRKFDVNQGWFKTLLQQIGQN